MIVTKHPACGLIRVREISIEVRLKERVRRKLDDLAYAGNRSRDLLIRVSQVPVGLLECPAPLPHQKGQIDDDNPVNGEQQGLKGGLKNRIPRTHNERVGRKGQAEQNCANSGPNTCKQARRQNRGKKQHVWSACSGQRDKPYSERERYHYRGDSEKIANCGLLK